jgi:hypothetical protein
MAGIAQQYDSAPAPDVDRLAIEHRPLGDLGRGSHDLPKLRMIAVESGDEFVAVKRLQQQLAADPGTALVTMFSSRAWVM